MSHIHTYTKMVPFSFFLLAMYDWYTHTHTHLNFSFEVNSSGENIFVT